MAPGTAGTKTLAELGLTAQSGAEAQVSGLAVDSRLVKPGYLFAALPGAKAHGADFIAMALEKGAGAILTDPAGAQLAADELAGSHAALIVTQDPRQALAMSAALWFGAQPQIMAAVTGTNGKTSVATFTRQIWELLGFSAINIGTTGVEGAISLPSGHTTPEPITLHRVLAEAAAQGVSHAVMEASSHGLDQRRLDGVRLEAAGFTNFTQDHLDYHESFEAYFAAKRGLFDRVLPQDGLAVINTDDPKGMELAKLVAEMDQPVLTIGRHGRADMQILAQRFDATGQDLRFMFQGQIVQLRLPLIGGFQADNVLLAAGLVMACGASIDEVFAVLPRLQTVRGRMQLAATRDNGATVFVDYAHTPDAVKTAIGALRPHVMGRLIAIIGAGGDRDRGKRPLMGQAAAAAADIVIVTDDNPRSEDPADIRAAVMQGCPDAIEVADRAEAILRAVDMLGPGDALLIAGKGHESGQVIGDDVLPFDDTEQASLAVAALDGRV